MTGKELRESAEAIKPVKKQDEVVELLERYTDKVGTAAGVRDELQLRKMIEAAQLLYTQNKNLHDCLPASIVRCVIAAANMKLDVSKERNHVYFVPRWDRSLRAKVCEMQIGYQGYIEMVLRTGKVTTIEAHIVRTDDAFKYTLGTEVGVWHTPVGGKITHVYAIATMTETGQKVIAVLTVEEIEDLRKRNPRQSEGLKDAWKTDYPTMAKAKAIRQLTKYLPQHVDYGF